MPRGGKRKGAGRKPAPDKHKHSVFVPDSVWRRLGDQPSEKIARLVEEKMDKRFFRAVLQETTNPERMFNGGDYTEGVTVVQENGNTVGGRYWSSSDFDICHGCGRYEQRECCEIYQGPTPEENPELTWTEVSPGQVGGMFLPLLKKEKFENTLWYEGGVSISELGCLVNTARLYPEADQFEVAALAAAILTENQDEEQRIALEIEERSVRQNRRATATPMGGEELD